MEWAKRIAWMMAGVLVGAFTSGLIHAQPRNPQPSRLMISGTDTLEGRNVHFVKDSRSDGCWLLISSTTRDGEFGIAAAPPSACQRN